MKSEMHSCLQVLPELEKVQSQKSAFIPLLCNHFLGKNHINDSKIKAKKNSMLTVEQNLISRYFTSLEHSLTPPKAYV